MEWLVCWAPQHSLLQGRAEAAQSAALAALVVALCLLLMSGRCSLSCGLLVQRMEP